MVRLSDNGDAAGDEEAAGLGEICGRDKGASPGKSRQRGCRLSKQQPLSVGLRLRG